MIRFISFAGERTLMLEDQFIERIDPVLRERSVLEDGRRISRAAARGAALLSAQSALDWVPDLRTGAERRGGRSSAGRY